MLIQFTSEYQPVNNNSRLSNSDLSRPLQKSAVKFLQQGDEAQITSGG